MDKANKTPKKVSVKFNNVVIFSHPDESVAIECALMLHRTSNEPHCIDICSEDKTIVALFTRK